MFLARYAAAWAEQEPNWPDAESLVWLLVTAPPCPAIPRSALPLLPLLAIQLALIY